MITRTMVMQLIKRYLFGVLLGLVVLSLAACNLLRPGTGTEPAAVVTEEPTAPPAEVPTTPVETEPAPVETELVPVEPTEAPAETEPVPTEVPTTPVETEPLPIPTEPSPLPTVRLPVSEVNDLMAVAEANDLEFTPLAVENTVIYALPESDGGVVFLLTPALSSLGFSSKELAAAPDKYTDRMLGGLTVVRQVNNELPALPPDDYVITLSPDRSKVIFTGAQARFEFPSVIRSLPQILPRSVALITASQMCLAWDVTQVCALVDSPLPGNWIQPLQDATQNLQVDAGRFDLERAVPDIEGVWELQDCASALSPIGTGQEPDYTACGATVLAVPAVTDGAFLLPSDTQVPPGAGIGIGLVVGLRDVVEEVFLDPQLAVPSIRGNCVEYESPCLPSGDYLTYEVRLKGDPEINGGIFERRVLLLGPAGEEFYLPAISGGVIIGTPVWSSGPSNRNEAVITNLWIRGRCFFKRRQCPWL